MSRIALHFGAGNIGRGFLGQIYFESGLRTVFVDIDASLVAALHAAGAYPLDLVDRKNTSTLRIENVDALHASDVDAIADTLARAEIASTAVGVHALPRIAPLIAEGLRRRFEVPGVLPLNILVCENRLDAAGHLRDLVAAELDLPNRQIMRCEIAFLNTSIGRMVPVPGPEERAADPLRVRAEPYCELPAEAAAKGVLPSLAHVHWVADFDAVVEEKLFLHNMTHAATAYLGHWRGHTLIADAIDDPEVFRIVRAAAREIVPALARKHALDPDDLAAHAEDLLDRYANTALGDTVARVARDPVRKLGHADRLVGAARLCEEQGIPPDHIALATAAAIRYDDPKDPTAPTLAQLLSGGLDAVLTQVCGLAPDSPLGARIAAAMDRLGKG